jgi:hypothetical protein
MSLNLDPMGINGPGWSGNAQQANVSNPTVNANVADYSVGANALNISQPITAYVQPGTTYTVNPAWGRQSQAAPE